VCHFFYGARVGTKNHGRVVGGAVWTIGSVRRFFIRTALCCAMGLTLGSVLGLGVVLSGVAATPYLLAVQAAYPAFVFLAVAGAGVATIVRRRAVLRLSAAVCMLWAAFLGEVHLQAKPLHNPRAAAFTVVAANLLYTNVQPRTVVAALVAHDADVLVTVETPPAVASALATSGYRMAARGWMLGSNTMVWSTHPARALPPIVLNDRSLPVAEVQLPGGPVIVTGVHLMSPTSEETLRRWKSNWEGLLPSLTALDGPVVVAGDFNTSRVHQPMRKLAESYDNSSARSIFSPFHPTWPTIPYQWWSVPVQIFDLDHVLVRGVAVHAYDRFAIPGSDHLGVRADLAQLRSS